MNGLACRVMVSVAGMAVLEMTPTEAGAHTHPASYALNDVMQAPFASDMLAAPTGAAVAWVFNAKGCSNIWVADPSHDAEHDVIVIPNEIHDLARYSSWMMLFNAADAYFDRRLNKPSAPSP